MPALHSGSRLGAYEILAPIGSGGMGEVYRARDSKLKRDVAIKVLPLELSRDPDRLARAQREAEVLAALNHPHIAQIYGQEKAGESRCLVLEFVDGETLQERQRFSHIERAGTTSIESAPQEAVRSCYWDLPATKICAIGPPMESSCSI